MLYCIKEKIPDGTTFPSAKQKPNRHLAHPTTSDHSEASANSSFVKSNNSPPLQKPVTSQLIWTWKKIIHAFYFIQNLQLQSTLVCLRPITISNVVATLAC